MKYKVSLDAEISTSSPIEIVQAELASTAEHLAEAGLWTGGMDNDSELLHLEVRVEEERDGV